MQKEKQYVIIILKLIRHNEVCILELYQGIPSSSMIFKFFLNERLDYLNVGGFRPSQKGCHDFERQLSRLFFFFKARPNDYCFSVSVW